MEPAASAARTAATEQQSLALVPHNNGTPGQLARISSQAFDTLATAFNSLALGAHQFYGAYLARPPLSLEAQQRQEFIERSKRLEKEIAVAEVAFEMARKSYEAAKREASIAHIDAVEKNKAAYEKLSLIQLQLTKLKQLALAENQPQPLPEGIESANVQREELATQLYADISQLIGGLKNVFDLHQSGGAKKGSSPEDCVCSKSQLFTNYEMAARVAQQAREIYLKKRSEENRLKREMDEKSMILNSLLEEQLKIQGKKLFAPTLVLLDDLELSGLSTFDDPPAEIYYGEPPDESYALQAIHAAQAAAAPLEMPAHTLQEAAQPEYAPAATAFPPQPFLPAPQPPPPVSVEMLIYSNLLAQLHQNQK